MLTLNREILTTKNYFVVEVPSSSGCLRFERCGLNKLELLAVSHHVVLNGLERFELTDLAIKLSARKLIDHRHRD